jgi:hypothetical protein
MRGLSWEQRRASCLLVLGLEPALQPHSSHRIPPVGVARRQLPAVYPWVPMLLVDVRLQHFPQLLLWQGGAVRLRLVQVRLQRPRRRRRPRAPWQLGCHRVDSLDVQDLLPGATLALLLALGWDEQGLQQGCSPRLHHSVQLRPVCILMAHGGRLRRKTIVLQGMLQLCSSHAD